MANQHRPIDDGYQLLIVQFVDRQPMQLHHRKAADRRFVGDFDRRKRFDPQSREQSIETQPLLALLCRSIEHIDGREQRNFERWIIRGLLGCFSAQGAQRLLRPFLVDDLCRRIDRTIRDDEPGESGRTDTIGSPGFEIRWKRNPSPAVAEHR